MSLESTEAVWEDPDPRCSNERLVLLALAWHADEGGYCWPSMETLAAKASCSPRNVMRLVQRLEGQGKLFVERGKGRGNSNRYIVLSGLSEADVRQTLQLRMEKSEAEAIGITTRIKGDNPDTFLKRDRKRKKVTTSAENVTSRDIKRDRALSPEPSVIEKSVIEKSIESGGGGTGWKAMRELIASVSEETPAAAFEPHQKDFALKRVTELGLDADSVAALWLSCQTKNKPVGAFLRALEGQGLPYKVYAPQNGKRAKPPPQLPPMPTPEQLAANDAERRKRGYAA